MNIREMKPICVGPRWRAPSRRQLQIISTSLASLVFNVRRLVSTTRSILHVSRFPRFVQHLTLFYAFLPLRTFSDPATSFSGTLFIYQTAGKDFWDLCLFWGRHRPLLHYSASPRELDSVITAFRPVGHGLRRCFRPQRQHDERHDHGSYSI